VALHAAGPLGAARVSGRLPDTDPDSIRAALAQVAELAALLITDETIRAEPVPDIAETLELLAVQGSALEAKPLAELKVALAAMRVTAADLKRLETTHDARRTGTLRTDPPPKELETKLTQSISPDGEVLDGASKDLARARQRVREARKHVMDKLGTILGGLDQTERAPDAAVTIRNGRYVIMESEADPTGGNADGNVELFFYDIKRLIWRQITNTVAPVDNRRPSTQTGKEVLFDSTFDFTGA